MGGVREFSMRVRQHFTGDKSNSYRCQHRRCFERCRGNRIRHQRNRGQAGIRACSDTSCGASTRVVGWKRGDMGGIATTAGGARGRVHTGGTFS